MSYLDDFFDAQDEDNPLNVIWQTHLQVRELQMRDVQMRELGEAARDLGDAEIRVRIPNSDQLRFWISPDDLYDEIGIHAHLASFSDDGTAKVWIDSEAGLLHAHDIEADGTIDVGTGSSAGGWFINSTSIFSGSITLDSATPSIKIGSVTDYMTGAGIFMGLHSAAYKFRVGDPATKYLAYDGSNLSASGQWIAGSGLNPSLQTWKTNIVFSASSATVVAWTSGTIRLNDATTYSISSGNTGTMAALTYIYLDTAVSTTVLQVTTTYSTAVGSGKILIASALNNTTSASVIPMGGQQPVIDGGAQIAALSILAGNIAAGAITASKISVANLAAVSANMGALTVDSTIKMGSATDYLTGAGMFIGLSSGLYKFHIGDPAGQYMAWSGSGLNVSGQWITGAGLNPSLQTWKTNIVFSASSATVVAWTSGTIRLNDSTTYSISSGNTGTMAALTYIYLDIAVSTTVLQVTTTYSTAVGSGKILVATALNNTTSASVMPLGGQQPTLDGGGQIAALSIVAGSLAAGSVTASKISVTNLAAISANMGALTVDSTIKMGSATDYLTGTGMFMGLHSGAYKFHIGNPSGNYLAWNATSLSVSGQWISGAGLNPSLQSWTTNIVFSSASATQVNWTTGTIRLNDSTTYSISPASNTGTMAALTYIYLDTAVSTTALQVTTTYSTAVGSGKILVAVAQNNTTAASVIPMGGQQPVIDGGVQIAALSILAGNIAAGAVTASKISVTDLAAINANLGAVTINTSATFGASGTLNMGATGPTTGTGLHQRSDGIYLVSSGVQQSTLTSAGISVGKGAIRMDVDGINVNESGAFFLFNNNGGSGSYSIGAIQNAGEQGLQQISFTVVSTASITNPGAESASLTGWSTVSGSPSASTDQAKTGSYSFKLPSASIRSSSFINVLYSAGLLELWMYHSAYGAYLTAEIECYDSGSTLLGVANLNSIVTMANGETSKWRRFFFLGVYLAGTTKIKIKLTGTGGTIYVDDIVYRDGGGYIVGVTGSGEARMDNSLTVSRSLTVSEDLVVGGTIQGNLIDDAGLDDWKTVVKTADESIQSNISLHDDTELAISIPANKLLFIRARVFFDTAAAADFKYRWQFTQTPSLFRAFIQHIVPGTTALVPSIETNTPTTTNAVAGAGTTGGYVELQAILKNGASAGIFKFQWAQNTSTAANTTVLGGSFIERKAGS